MISLSSLRKGIYIQYFMKKIALLTLFLFLGFVLPVSLPDPATAADTNDVKKLLKNKRCPRCNLSSAVLRGQNLSRAQLDGANLSYAKLRGANLRGANLSRANLSNAGLSSANLRSANLRNANLQRADLSGANMRGANLGGADLRGANLRGANLRGAKTQGAKGVTGVNTSEGGDASDGESRKRSPRRTRR